MKSSFVIPEDLDPLERFPKAAAPGEPIRRHNPMCYGCGQDVQHGLRMDVRAGEGFTVDATLQVEQWMEGGPGVLHGGLLTTAFDEVMSTLPFLIGPSTVTAHIEVDFAAPIPVGSRVTMRGELLGRQRRKIYAAVAAYVDGSENPAAVGHSIFVAIDVRTHFADHVENSALSGRHKERLARP